MSLKENLEAIKRANDADVESIEQFGPQILGRSGVKIESILAIDRETKILTSSKLVEFYRFSKSWKHVVVELEWIDPDQLPILYAKEKIEKMIRNDISNGILKSDPSQYSLFAVDDLDQPFQRAYLQQKNGGSELSVIDAGSEIKEFSDVEEYVTFWKDVITG